MRLHHLAALVLLASSPGLASAARLDEALQSPYQIEQTCTPGECERELCPAGDHGDLV